MAAQIDRKMALLRPGKAVVRLLCWALFEGRPLTTKGRWINPLVFCGYRLAQIFPSSAAAHDPIYVVGTGRSGTTILGKILSVHKDVVFLNEPKALWHYARHDEDIIGSYSKVPGRIRLSYGDMDDTTKEKLTRVYASILRLMCSKKIVDKYPEIVFRIDFVLRLLPNARFVAITRDGVDTCTSVTAWSARHQIRSPELRHDWWGLNDRKWSLMVSELVAEHPDLLKLHDKLLRTFDHRDRAAVEWIVSMREIKVTAAKHQSVTTISYEALCADASAAIDEISRHCNLEPDRKVYEYAKHVLHVAPKYSDLELMPELVEPFKTTLTEMGYSESVNRVTSRV